MYLRCPYCRSTFWAEVIRPTGLPAAVECAVCHESSRLEPVVELECSVRGHYHRTMELSNSTGLDMASAYSVVLGILTVDRARRMQESGAAAEAKRDSSSKGAASSLLLDIDPGFRKAVYAGQLSIEEAVRRGDRATYIAGLIERHRLPERLASRVADKGMTLHDAIELVPKREAPRPRRPSASRSQAVIVLGSAALILSSVSWIVWSRNFKPADRHPVQSAAAAAQTHDVAQLKEHPEPRSVPEVKRAATEVQTDAAGQMIRLVGPDPETVLLAYCDGQAAVLGHEPIEITETLPPLREARLGVFRDLESLGSLHAIRIQRDRRTRRWVAGNGRGPIPRIELAETVR